MKDILQALLGVPATMLIAAGLGIIVVTIVSRFRKNRDPVRWEHFVLGFGLGALGVVLLVASVNLFGIHA